MGNSSTKEATEEAKANRSLNLSCKLTPKQYVKVNNLANFVCWTLRKLKKITIISYRYYTFLVLVTFHYCDWNDVITFARLFFQHTSGEFVEGGLLALPWEMYSNTVTLYESVNASFNFISEVSMHTMCETNHTYFCKTFYSFHHHWRT